MGSPMLVEEDGLSRRGPEGRGVRLTAVAGRPAGTDTGESISISWESSASGLGLWFNCEGAGLSGRAIGAIPCIVGLADLNFLMASSQVIP